MGGHQRHHTPSHNGKIPLQYGNYHHPIERKAGTPYKQPSNHVPCKEFKALKTHVHQVVATSAYKNDPQLEKSPKYTGKSPGGYE